MADTFYGATQAEWEAWSSLILPDVLPTVCDPNVLRHPASASTGLLDKTPSAIDAQGFGYGLLRWPDLKTTSVHDWMVQPALGICVIARTLHAIDIDVADVADATYIEGFVREHFGIDGMLMPLRTRQGTGKRLLMFRLQDGPERIKKDLVRIDGSKAPLKTSGLVEFLFHRQQFRVAGRHRSGGRLEWPDGIPTKLDQVPAVAYADLVDLIRRMREELGVEGGEASESTVVPSARSGKQVAESDPMVAYIRASDWLRSESYDGALNVHCPWAGDHAHPTPDNETEARFFPIGLGEIKDQPGFKCMHATCNHRNWQMFLSAIGYEDTLFPVVQQQQEEEPAAATRPHFTYKGRSNIIEATLTNVANALRWPAGFGYVLRYDAFKDAIVYRGIKENTWRLLDDDSYTIFRLRLTQIGMEGNVPKEHVVNAVSLVAREKTVDTAQEWLKSLPWDGVPRIAHFHSRVLKLEDTPYHQAVGLYLWTALAGRIMEPGCKADMMPILIGKQGLRKSTVAELMVPSPDEYAAVTLANRDADLARQLRGKLVAEWDELRGLNTRDAEAIKGWLTHRYDEWVPKFKEHAVKIPRRYVVIGTANETQILNDPTGARRMLPVRVTGVIDTDYVLQHREQLWAEARETWMRTGIQWQNAERLAGPAHRAATVRDLWEPVVVAWLRDQGNRDGWASIQILSGACSVPMSQANRGSHERLRRVMVRLGWEEGDDGKWYCSLA